MPSYSLVYPMAYIGTDGVNHLHRPYLPIILESVKTSRVQRFMALADTGADACLIPGGVTKILGCKISDGKPNINGASGIGANKMPTWKHDLRITLLTPDKLQKAFVCPPLEIDCTEHSGNPLLLGTMGFLQHFKASFDYHSKRLILEFNT